MCGFSLVTYLIGITVSHWWSVRGRRQAVSQSSLRFFYQIAQWRYDGNCYSCSSTHPHKLCGLSIFSCTKILMSSKCEAFKSRSVLHDWPNSFLCLVEPSTRTGLWNINSLSQNCNTKVSSVLIWSLQETDMNYSQRYSQFFAGFHSVKLFKL